MPPYVQKLLLGLGLAIISGNATAKDTWYKVREITESKLVYFKIEPTTIYEMDLSDIELSTPLLQELDLFPYFYSELPDFKLQLLRNGVGKLRNPRAASSSYQQAELDAKTTGQGVWATKSTWWQYVWRAFRIVGAVGLLGFLAKLLLKKLYYERKVQLLILGKPGAGKTALYKRLTEPHLPPTDLLSLTPTRVVARNKKKKPIAHGRLEIYPVLTDVPGSQFGVAWDQLIGGICRRVQALVLVVAPTKKSKLSSTDEKYDTRYLDEQIGYLEAFVEGPLGSQRLTRPRVVILFINKFDLYAGRTPEDSASKQMVDELSKVFAGHIDRVVKSAQRAKVEHRIVMGSAAQNWNCHSLLGLVADGIFGS